MLLASVVAVTARVSGPLRRAPSPPNSKDHPYHTESVWYGLLLAIGIGGEMGKSGHGKCCMPGRRQAQGPGKVLPKGGLKRCLWGAGPVKF